MKKYKIEKAGDSDYLVYRRFYIGEFTKSGFVPFTRKPKPKKIYFIHIIAGFIIALMLVLLRKPSS